MKESYSFQPRKEVVEILREIEKQTEETFNKNQNRNGTTCLFQIDGLLLPLL